MFITFYTFFQRETFKTRAIEQMKDGKYKKGMESLITASAPTKTAFLALVNSEVGRSINSILTVKFYTQQIYI